jgi:hypothetical protein
MEQWLRDLPLAPKVHIRSLMYLVMRCAERGGVIAIGKNPSLWCSLGTQASG